MVCSMYWHNLKYVMTMRNNKISDLMAKATRKFNNEEGYLTYLRFMVDCLKLIQDDCPDVANNAISTAEKFCNGDSSSDELTNARVACWDFLNKKKKNQGSRKKEDCQIRAVICALHPSRDPDDFFDSLDWFCEHFCKIDSFENVVLDKLKFHFQID